MARSRNIKPSFFTNDILADIEPLGRLFFIGLWTIADYQGNIEWRERRLKAQILPYDNCDIKEIAINLDKSGFIRFYSNGDNIFLNIINFCIHQNPHKNERDKGSVIPCFNEKGRQVIDFKELVINRDVSGLDQDENASDHADSLNLIPDSLNLIPDKVKTKKTVKRFVKPNFLEASQYFHELGSKVCQDDANDFIDHFKSNGWKVGGKAPMKDWKAAIRKWFKNSKKYSNQGDGNASKQNGNSKPTIDLDSIDY